jgi:hypothetical protein
MRLRREIRGQRFRSNHRQPAASFDAARELGYIRLCADLSFSLRARNKFR